MEWFLRTARIEGNRGRAAGGVFGARSHKRWSLRLVACVIDLEHVERVGGCLPDTTRRRRFLWLCGWRLKGDACLVQM